MDILMLNETEVQRLLDPDALLDALAESFRALSSGLVDAPKRIGVSVPNTGFLLAMPAYQQSQAITVKLVSVFHGNKQLGIPTHQALICLFDPQTGTPLSFMDGTSITALRTAGAAALSTRLLARTNTHVLAIVGAGVEGHAHLKMLPHVRPFSEIRVASRHFAHGEQLAATDARARAVETAEEAVRGADVVCLCTSAGEPVVRLDWLAPGMHVTSVGYAPPRGDPPGLRAPTSGLWGTGRFGSERWHGARRGLAGPTPGTAIRRGAHRLQGHGARLRGLGCSQSRLSLC